jgi:hypothetical protein
MRDARKPSAPSTHVAIIDLLALGGCGTPTDLPLEESNQPIVNGPVAPDFAQQGTPRVCIGVRDYCCSSVVYSKYWVITAAHCFQAAWDVNNDGVISGSEKPSAFYVDRVVIDRAGHTGEIQIDAAYRHPNSAGWGSGQGTDVALVKLNGKSSGVYVPYLYPVNYSNGKLKIYNGSTASLQDQYVLAFGWGYFSNVLPWDNNLHKGWKIIYKTDYTGADKGTYGASQYNEGGTTCHGDSGGPDYLWDGTGFEMTGIHCQAWPDDCATGADHVDLNRGAEMWRNWVVAKAK